MPKRKYVYSGKKKVGGEGKMHKRCYKVVKARKRVKCPKKKWNVGKFSKDVAELKRKGKSTAEAKRLARKRQGR